MPSFRFGLLICLAGPLAASVGCTSDSKPEHNAGSIHQTLPKAAKKVAPRSELKSLDGRPMQGMPDGLKAMDETPKPEPSPSVAGLKTPSGTPAAGLPSGLKAFPAAVDEEPEAEEPEAEEPAAPAPRPAAG